ncbi:hypothetical protein [Candidatus Symbiopectobacterium sp.]|uniref:hypothetical protein n=1 Tax=Candidatus Symbiopectobacterium sp. TaxID=2816440 RepID=UPI0025C5523D|nr:hypothetical protein [Candidatus Symbiopectobacterium sp.]
MVICSDDYPKVLFIQQSRKKHEKIKIYRYLQLQHPVKYTTHIKYTDIINCI